MRIRPKALLIAALAVSTVFGGWAGEVRYPTYYTLHVPPPPDPAAGQGAHPSVSVREFRAPVYLRQGPLVYRESPEQIGFYEYHRWASGPRQFVTGAVADRLNASSNFAQVTLYDGRSHADYIISGRLEIVEEV